MEPWMEALKAHDQMQVLRFYDELSSDQKEHLKKQVETLDFQELETAKKARFTHKKGEITPHETMTLAKIAARREEYEEAGRKALERGEVGCVLLAGGQGTRLGYTGPKGCMNLGSDKEPKFIFQTLIENMEENQRGLEKKMYLYIMTSSDNHEETAEFFRSKKYFGYPEDHVFFFTQDNAPALDLDCKILLSHKYSISMAPNGNGGWFTSLVKAGLIEQMEAQGIRWINVFSVDNILQNIGDPLFTGACIVEKKDCGAKVIEKVEPGERVGAICLRDGRPSVVEYSELTPEMMNAKDEAGNYLYNYGVTLNYLFNLEKTKEAAKTPLPVHLAKKILHTIDDQGREVKTEEPNGYKLEYFIFDILESFDSCLSFEVVREDEFAPIKNRSGVDSIDTAKALYEAKKGYSFPKEARQS